MIDETNDLIYSTPETSYKLYDILWSDGKATQEVRPVSDGVVPIGLCVIPTNWLDEGEKARFVSLKYMSSETPESGGLIPENMWWGAGYGDVSSPIPFENPENDPLIPYYVPYVAKDIKDDTDAKRCYYYFDSMTGTIKNLRQHENWLEILNYCKENAGKYAIGDINGKQNTINISIDGVYYDNGDYPDMKLQVAKYVTKNTNAGDWYIPAAGELLQFTLRLMSEHNNPSINDKVAEISKVYPQDCVTKFQDFHDSYYNEKNDYYWSSTVFDNYSAICSSFKYYGGTPINGVSIYPRPRSSYAQYSAYSEGCLVVAFLLR